MSENSGQADLNVTEGSFTVWIVFTGFTRKNFVWFNINTAWIWKIYIINRSFSPIRSNFAFTLDDERRVNSYLCFSQTTYGSFCIFLSILVLCADKIYRFRIYLIFLVAVEIHSDFYIKSDPGSYTQKNFYR